MAVRTGWCDDELCADFPGVGIFALATAVADGAAASAALRLEQLANRIDGRNVASLPLRPVPAAYRALARQLGLDPDADGTPLAEVLRDRIRYGGLPARGAVVDACTCAMLETGVPIFALPYAEVAGDLGLTLARGGEMLPGEDGAVLAEGAVVVSDVARPLALALLAPALTPAEYDDLLLYAVRAPGVVDLEVSEALWVASALLQAAA